MSKALIIWDLDHTLYEDLTRWMSRAAFLTARAFKSLPAGQKSPITEEQAAMLASKSFRETGFGVKDLSDHSDVNPTELHLALHGLIDPEKVITAQEMHMRRAFEQLAGKPVTNAILTHGSKNWAKRATQFLSINEFFNNDLIFGAETIDFQSKAKSRAPFNMVIERANALSQHGPFQPEHITVIEDSPRNLLTVNKMGLRSLFLYRAENLDPTRHPFTQVRTATEAAMLVHNSL